MWKRQVVLGIQLLQPIIKTFYIRFNNIILFSKLNNKINKQTMTTID